VKSSPKAPGSCLHLVAGAGREALEDCVSRSAPGDALLFLDAGVLHLLQHANGSVTASAATAIATAVEVHYLSADLQARGLLELARRLEVSVVGDATFGELLAAHDHCLTWT
jgi:sulfur relay protein TusB/DsrH